jgi:hypothetical protein
MKNIFNNLTIPNNYFFKLSLDITHDLCDYLDDNLEDENYIIFRWNLKNALTTNTLTWDLKNALTNNANGKYI